MTSADNMSDGWATSMTCRKSAFGSGKPVSEVSIVVASRREKRKHSASRT
jgi:hypothetical protein